MKRGMPEPQCAVVGGSCQETVTEEDCAGKSVWNRLWAQFEIKKRKRERERETERDKGRQREGGR